MYMLDFGSLFLDSGYWLLAISFAVEFSQRIENKGYIGTNQKLIIHFSHPRTKNLNSESGELKGAYLFLFYDPIKPKIIYF